MKGFKRFILHGNVIELGVAFLLAAAFGTVVTSLVSMVMDLLGKIGGEPNFSSWNPGGVSVGAFLTALVAFVILALIVYFFVIAPYTTFKERNQEEVEDTADVALLTEIRDLLASRERGGGTSPPSS